MGEKIPEVANVDRTKDIQEHGLLKCHSTTLPILERATRSERADGLGKSLSGLWHREVSESGTEAATVRAAVSKVLPVIEGLMAHRRLPSWPPQLHRPVPEQPLRNT